MSRPVYIQADHWRVVLHPEGGRALEWFNSAPTQAHPCGTWNLATPEDVECPGPVARALLWSAERLLRTVRDVEIARRMEAKEGVQS